MDQIELQSATREVLGKKVRFLRRQGITPVNLFGHGIDSVSLQCDSKELQRVLGQARRTKIINLKVDKTKKPRNVMIRDVQKDPLTREVLHVDLYQISMTEKIKVDVPILLLGDAPALKVKDNMLMQDLHSLSIECLPNRIPDHIEIDLSPLVELDQAIQVKDIKLGEGITTLHDPDHIVVKIGLRPKEKVVEVVEEVVAAEVTAEEGAAAPEGEAKAETKEE